MALTFQYPATLFALALIPALLALAFAGRATRARQFWIALGLRALVLLALILGLAGAHLVQAVDDTTVVFVVDHSDSVLSAEQKRAEDFIRAALPAMRPGDRAAVVVFGENALVERLASDDAWLAPVTSIPRTTRTNLAGALRLALALFPDETHKRIVILSDGLENVGRARDVIDLARARGVTFDVVPLRQAIGANEVYLDALDAPANVRQGQAFEIVATVKSVVATPVTVRLLGDGKLLATRAVNLPAGVTRIAFAATAEQPGFRRYTAELSAPNDTLAQNNFASTFTVAQGPPRVLVVASVASDAANLLAALQSARIEATPVAPRALPGDLATLANYDAVFLVNVPAQALPDAAMNALPVFVRDLGRGLVMIGGADAYGAGGYLRTPVEKALPVEMSVRSRLQEPNLALVFVLDKSGSMARCHCDNPSLLPGQYARVESGLSKVDIAKDAVMQATRALGSADYVGVVAFDSDALWALRLQALSEPGIVQQKIGGIEAVGQTNVYAGLSEAEAALVQTPARLKHILLVTDGWSMSFQFAPLAQRLRDEGITLSVVAAGGGSATYLDQLARAGGGRYYPAQTMTQVPQLFFRETVQAQGLYIVEEAFVPIPAGASPILRGLEVTQLPALRGYNGATPKATARVALVSAQGDPILATWQFGLGRAVAWTSDAKGMWASDWVRWEKFNTFVAQMMTWVLPQADDAGLQVAFDGDGEQTRIVVTAQDADKRPRDLLDTRATLIAPDLTAQTIPLPQVAPGVYRAVAPVAAPGVYLAQITQAAANGDPVARATAGLIVPYSPEYKWSEANVSVLPELARATGGRILAEPQSVFVPSAMSAARTEPIWQTLLLIAACLFPLDVAARRLRITRADTARAGAAIRATLAPRPAAPSPRALGALFRARARAARVPAPKPATPRVETPLPPSSSAAPPPAAPEEMAERLKRAKARARKMR